MRISVGSNRKTFGLFGNSAGSQYVLRYLALTEAAAVDVAVASNSGMYMLPDLTIDYPTGMGGLDLDESYQRRYLGRRLTILLGDADTDSAAPDLPRSETAMAQGPHRARTRSLALRALQAGRRSAWCAVGLEAGNRPRRRTHQSANLRPSRQYP